MRITAFVSLFSVLVLVISSLLVPDVGSNDETPNENVEVVGTHTLGCREGNDTSDGLDAASYDSLNLTYKYFYNQNPYEYWLYDSIGLYWEWPWNNSPVQEFQVFYGICSCELKYINSTKGDEPYYIRDYLVWRKDAEDALSYVNRFFIQVVALNSNGESTFSEVVEVMKPSFGRPLVVDVSSPPGKGYVGITWEPPEYKNVEGPAEYRLYKYLLYDYNVREYLATVDANTTYWEDYDVVFGKEFTYIVEVVYPCGIVYSDSGDSIIASAWPEEALDGTVSTGAVILNWEAPYSGPERIPEAYHLFRTTNMYSFYEGHRFSHPYSEDRDYLVEIDPDNTTYTDEGFISEELHYYAVFVVYTDDSYAMSNRITIQPMLGVPVMTDDWGISTDDRDGEVTLEWDSAIANQNYPVTAYRVYRGRQEGKMELIAEVEPSPRRFSDKDVGQKRTYFYHITAVNDIGEGKPTETREVYVGKEENAYNIQDLTPICCFGGILSAIILIIFLSGYVVGGWREGRKIRRKYGITEEPQVEDERPRNDVVFKRKGEEGPKNLRIPRMPQGRNR